MAAYRSRSQLFGTGGGSLTTNLTLAKPTGAVVGDYMLAVLNVGFGTNGLTLSSAPAGWTLLYASGPISRTNGFNYFWVYGKAVAGGDPANWTWTVSQQVAFYNCQAISFSDCNGAQPYEELSSTSGTPASGGTLSRTANTTITDDLLVTVLMSGAGSSPDPSWTENVGTEVFDDHGGSGCAVALNTLSMPTPGSQTVTGTVAGGGATLGAAVVQLALLPAIIVVGKSLVQPYGVKALAGRSLALPYTQIGVIARSLVQPYTVRVFLPVSLAVPYKVLVPSGRSLLLVYPVRQMLGKTLVMSYGLAFAVPIPGKSGIDTYADGASSPFGLAANEAADLSIFATWVSIPWYPPEGLEEMQYGRLPHFEAQEVFELSPIDTKSVRRARVGWHGTKFDRERGSFAIVSIDGPLADLVGERLRLTFSDLPRTKSIFVYVHDEAVLADDADISLPRREFLSLALLHETTVDVNIEVAG